MIPSLEMRLIGRRVPVYAPANGFELLIGDQPIKILSSESHTIESKFGRGEVQLLRLAEKSGFTRQIALIAGERGERASVFFYQDPTKTNRKPEDSKLLDLTNDTKTLSQIRVQPINGLTENILLKTDSLAAELAKKMKDDCQQSKIKYAPHIGLSGGSIVINTLLSKEEFLQSKFLQESIGNLFNQNGPFSSTVIFPQAGQEEFMKNIQDTGAQILLPPDGFELKKDDYLLGARLFLMRFFEKIYHDDGNDFHDFKEFIRIRLNALRRTGNPVTI